MGEANFRTEEFECHKLPPAACDQVSQTLPALGTESIRRHVTAHSNYPHFIFQKG